MKIFTQRIKQKALEIGCEFIKDNVEEIDFENDIFKISTSRNVQLSSKIIIGAFGKRSNIDQKINRNFIVKKSPWLAVKAHYRGEFPSNLVGLHNFEGGYCGVSQVENGNLNVCYLANYKSFQRYKNIDAFNRAVLYQNPHLKRIFEDSTPVFEQPLTISQISFSDKRCSTQ